MSSKILNDNTPYLNKVFLDMPFYRELFVDRTTSQRSDIYHTRQNTGKTNELLGALLSQGKNINNPEVKEEYSKLLSDFLISSQSGNKSISGGLDNLSHDIQGLGYGVNDLSSKMEDFAYQMSDSLESIYGSSLPENISLVDIGRKLSYYGKRTVVSLYIHGGIYDWKMKELFSPIFVEYLNKGLSSSTAREHQTMLFEKINELKELKSKIKSNIIKNNEIVQTNTTGNQYNMAINNIGNLNEKLKLVESNIQAISRHIMSKQEIDLLDVGLVARENNIHSLLQKKLIHPEVLEVLVRNKQINGNLSNEFSRIIQVNENGVVKPLIELDGITGIFQQKKAQTMLQNIIVRQNNLTNSHLYDINTGIREGFTSTIEAIDENTGEIRVVNDTLKKGFVMTNYNLDRISNFIQLTNKELGLVNTNLNRVENRIVETNIFLYDILSSSHKGNELLEYNNELQQITNEYLDRINMNILHVGEGLANILQGVGEMIWEGFEQTIQGINNIANIQYEQLKLSGYVLEELSKQTQILQGIDRSLKIPYSIKANEAFNQGLSCIKVSNIDFAIRSFEKGIDQDPTHLGNIFGAGLLYNIIGKTKQARKYLNAALKISSSTMSPILKDIYYELAKLEIKQLNLVAGKRLLQESMNTKESNLEIYLLQIDILLKLGNDTEAQVLANRLFDQIASGDYHCQGVKIRKNVSKFLERKISFFVDFLIKQHKIVEFTNIISFLEVMGYKDILGNVAAYLFDNNRELLHQKNIPFKKYISNNKKLKNTIIDFANKTYIGGNSAPYFYIAYQVYGELDQNTVNKIITHGLKFDMDYIYMNQTNSQSSKETYRQKLTQKIYLLGEGAKYMRRDYLQQNNIFKF